MEGLGLLTTLRGESDCLCDPIVCVARERRVVLGPKLMIRASYDYSVSRPKHFHVVEIDGGYDWDCGGVMSPTTWWWFATEVRTYTKGLFIMATQGRRE